MKIPILFDHGLSRVIGKIEENVITFMPEAKITDNMLFDAFNGGLEILESMWIDDKIRYILKARILELSISPRETP